MTNGYATDNSNGSNKRRRRGAADDDARERPDGQQQLPPGSKQAGTSNVIPKTPFEAGTAAYSQYVESLDESYRKLFRKHAAAVLQAYATHFNAKSNFLRERDDDDYVPQPCRHVLTLQPKKAVEKDPRFKDLLRDTDDAVKRAQLLLKKQYMKCVELNVEQLQLDVIEVFATAMPAIAKLQLASDDLLDESADRVVSDLLRHQKVNILKFLGTTEEDFAKIYCTVHKLDSFPPSSNPPLFTNDAAPAQAPVLLLRGGGGGGVTNPYVSRGSGDGNRAPPGPPPINANTRTPQSALRAENLNRDRFNVEDESTQLGITQLGQTSFDYDEEGNAQQANRPATQDSTDEQQQRVEFDVGGAGGRREGDTMDTSADVGERRNNPGANAENNEEGAQRGGQAQGQAGPPPIRTPGGQAQDGAARNYLTAAQLLRRGKLKTLHYKMVEFVEYLFVRPRIAYDEKVEQNARRMRMRRVEKELETVQLADRVAEAVAAEGTTTPKTIRVLIKDGIAAAEAKRKKQQDEQKNDKPEPKKSKNSKGAQRSGGAQTKKKSPIPNPNKKSKDQDASGRKGPRGRGSANAGRGTKGKKPRSKSKPRGSGK